MNAAAPHDHSLIADAYFDGRRMHADGPFAIAIADGVIRSILQTPHDAVGLRVPFVMPGLVEAHCHLFLDGDERDATVRAAQLKAPFEAMLATARRNVQTYRAAGVTLVRDAGDLYGVNDAIRAECRTPTVRSPGRAVRKRGRYGSFMADEVDDVDSLAAALRSRTAADDLKIIFTGIIDFEHGRMKGDVQFDETETRRIVEIARAMGKKTFAHCSGPEGLSRAVAAGIDSIEHGFFMEDDVLAVMAERQIAWVPTFSPVYFQYEQPQWAGWNEKTIDALQKILDRHFRQLAAAARLGVPIVAGSDAGSFGVPHGRGLVDELCFHRRAGLSLDETLASATSTPRRLWGCPSADVVVGNRAELTALAGSPADDLENLRRIVMTYQDGLHDFRPASAIGGVL